RSDSLGDGASCARTAGATVYPSLTAALSIVIRTEWVRRIVLADRSAARISSITFRMWRTASRDSRSRPMTGLIHTLMADALVRHERGRSSWEVISSHLSDHSA